MAVLKHHTERYWLMARSVEVGESAMLSDGEVGEIRRSQHDASNDFDIRRLAKSVIEGNMLRCALKYSFRLRPPTLCPGGMPSLRRKCASRPNLPQFSPAHICRRQKVYHSRTVRINSVADELGA
jgi:hypothetical protein